MRCWRTSLARILSLMLSRSDFRSDANVKTAFALAAGLAQIIAPTDAQVVNLLGFHVIAKLLVHYPAYLSNIALPRTVAHISATSALISKYIGTSTEGNETKS